jgi:adenosylcobinamide kinase/adenosylcobinamide-phosphate guanylyltransferase
MGTKLVDPSRRLDWGGGNRWELKEEILLSLTLVLGGARSGKSTWAEKLAAMKPPVLYIATAERGDREMEDRIRRHRQSRPAHWRTLEAPHNLEGVLREAPQTGTILIDCLTIYISNQLLALETKDPWEREELILKEIRTLGGLALDLPLPVIIVSNEVGCGIVPPYPLGREFRDLCGRSNQILATYSEHVYYTIAGIPVDVKQLGVPMDA